MIYILEFSGQMRKRIIIAFIVTFLFVVANVCGADTIFLKSGKVIEGKIVNETAIFVRIRTIENNTEEYLLPLIDHLEFDQQGDDDPKDPNYLKGREAALDTIILKSGRIIKGTIIRQTPIFVRIRTNDAIGVQNFTIENIERIDSHHGEAQEDSPQIVTPETTAGKAIDVTNDDTREDDAKVLTDVSTITETIPATKKIVPFQKVISRNTPPPYQPQVYRKTRKTVTPDTYGNIQNVAPNMTDFPDVRQEIARLENITFPDQASIAAQEKALTAAARAPHIFNTDAYNDFLDQNISTSSIKQKDARQQKESVKQVMAARSKTSSKGANQTKLEKIKEFIPQILTAIILGVGLPVLAGIVFLIICILKSMSKKEKNDEVESLRKLKADDKISEEEYANLASDAENRLSKSPTKSFLQLVPRIFMYPLRGQVLLATVGASFVFYIIRIAMHAPFYGFLTMIMASCYLVACIVKIIETAVTVEREDVFDWPGFTEWVDWFGKAFLFLIGWLICHGTALLILFKFVRYEGIQFFVVSLSVGLFVIGVFVYPMYILSMSLVGGVASLNIVNIVKAIGTTFIAYTLTFFLLILTQILNGLAHLIPIIRIPFFGGIFGCFIFVYFLLVNMRLLGLFYKTHRLKLRWYGEDD